jgi:uncharacterized protein YjiS (DUF1127 family)
MAFLDSLTRTPIFGGFRAALDARIEEQVAGRARFREYLRTHKELSALTKRELDDIGIDRSDISAIAYEQAYGSGRPRA